MSAKLAIDGGTPLITEPLPFTSLGAEQIGAEEEANVLAVLRSKRLNRYELPYDESFCGRLEAEIERSFNVKHALVTVSASEALQIAVYALGVGPGDEVIVPAVTWVTCANVVIAAGAVPVVAQVDATLSLDVADVERLINKRTKAIMVAHLHGFPANMEALMGLAKRHDLAVIEDNAQSAGATYQGKRLGTIGDAGCLSFNFMKFISAGDGGCVLTNRDDVYEYAVSYTGGAIFPKSKAHLNLKRKLMPATVLRMTELTGAVALAQFGRLEPMLKNLRATRDAIASGISACRSFVRGPSNDPAGDAGLSLPLMFKSPEACKRFGDALRAEGVPMAVSRDHMHFFGAEVMTIMRTVMSHQPVSTGRAIWATAWDAMLQKVPIHPSIDPWKHTLFTGKDGKVEYGPDLMAKSFELLGNLLFIRMNPRLDRRHAEQIAAAIRKVDAALAG